MKILSFLFAGLVMAFGVSDFALAQERPDHFEGEESASLEQALAQLATHGARLDAILARDELGPEDAAAVHELTYTLENALARIRAEVASLEATLEDVHVASERYEVETVRRQGRAFLDRAAPLSR